jgi:hypothetical protein
MDALIKIHGDRRLEVVNVSVTQLHGKSSFQWASFKNSRLIFGTMRRSNPRRRGHAPIEGYVALIIDRFLLVLESQTFYEKLGCYCLASSFFDGAVVQGGAIQFRPR